MALRASVLAVASAAAMLAACTGTNSPSAPTPITAAAILSVQPKTPVRLLPNVLEAKVQTFRPYSWAAGWTVTVTRADATDTRRLEIRSVTARIEASGRILAETVSLLGSRPLTGEGVSVEQSLTYESASPPPSQSRLNVTVHVFDENGIGQDVRTAGNTIQEQYCGGRAQGSCSGPYIAILGNGTLLTDSGVPEWTVWVGQTAYFFNGHNAPHRFRSDPHPGQTDCDALNPVDLNVLEYGYSDVFNEAGTCGFHDETDPDNTALRGRIVVRCCIF